MSRTDGEYEQREADDKMRANAWNTRIARALIRGVQIIDGGACDSVTDGRWGWDAPLSEVAVRPG